MSFRRTLSCVLARMRFSRIMLFVGSHGVSHPTREERSPGSAGSEEEEMESMDREAAAQALDAVEHG